jgi:predicted ATPase
MGAVVVFVGRLPELARLEGLAREGTELVTLRGPGGAGKTRLAREHAARERDVVFVDLSAARTAHEVALAIGSALGATADADAHPDADVATLARAMRARRALVVMDNVEQLDAAARAVVASIAGGGARVLATSREPLGDAREVIVDVGPLEEAPALALFDAVAARGGAGVDRETARAIVARLDALPLAIELAAARAALLGGAELLARLDRKLDVVASTTRGLPVRHASLRATIAWSWDLLDTDERAALQACATFEGAFDAVLAEAVIGGGESAALGALERLRARALLHAVDGATVRPMFRLLEAVRDYVRETVSTDALFVRHAAAVVARCEVGAEAVRRGEDAVAALALHQADLFAAARRGGPLRARAALALSALLAVTGPPSAVVESVSAVVGDADALVAARLLVARAAAHRATGAFDAARADVAAALSKASAIATPTAEKEAVHDARVVRADALRVEAAVSRTLGDAEGAVAHLTEALAIYREVGARAREGFALGDIAAAHQSAGRLTSARDVHARAIAIHVATKSRRAEGEGRSHLAVATHRAGDPAAAIALHERALAVHRETSHRRLEGAELLHLGFVHHEIGAPGAARDAFGRARATLAAAGALGLEALALVLAARLAVDENDPHAATVLLAEAGDVASWPRLAATRLLVAGHLATARGDAQTARDAYTASLVASRDVVVGFEALTPAYLAFALRRAGGARAREEAARQVEDARARVARFENPHLGVALAILVGASRDADARAAASSSEVRRALAFAGTRRALRVAAGARQVVLPDGRLVDLSRRKNVVAILAALARERRARPGRAVAPDVLLAAGWPGERMRAEAATKRLHTAIWTLRSLGLEGVLLTRDDGYLLDPSVPADIEDLD